MGERRQQAGGLGLRAKSLLALVLVALLAVAAATVVGNLALERARDAFAESSARTLTELNRDRLRAPLGRELALVQRLAGSLAVQHFLRDPSAPDTIDAFREEAAGFRQAFRDRSLFAVALADGSYWFADDEDPALAAPRYHVSAAEPKDDWFYASLRADSDYNINVNYDEHIQTTRVWFNAVVVHEGKRIGLTGSALVLDRFLADFIESASDGATPVIVDDQRLIQAHPDRQRIAWGSGAGGIDAERGGSKRLQSDRIEELPQLLGQARAAGDGIAAAWMSLEGKRQRVAAAYLPELNWYVLSAVDASAAQVLDPGWLPLLGTAGAALLLALLLGFGFAIERLLLRPVEALRGAAEAIAEGDYSRTLPAPGQDELGALNRAFARMAERVRSYTSELESAVGERTEALQQALDRILHSERLLLSGKMATAGQLTAGIAHEINNPLHYAAATSEQLQEQLQGFRDLLRQLAGDDADPAVMQAIELRLDAFAADLRAIREGCTRALGIVQDMRQFAGSDCGERTRTRLGDTLRATVNLARAQFKHDAVFEVQMPDDPELDCHPARLGQVFLNLLVNACHAVQARAAMGEPGYAGRVGLSGKLAGDWFMLAVEDNGCGIDPDLRERIFEPFFTTKPIGEGSGLGLALSQSIVAEHGGRIEVESTPGQGTRFLVRLPLPKGSPPA
ncbi:MAG TPA: ATP-binding protein [Arenimonas sp.]|nr:ATP-binding protein [Arenimonas sp.]